VVTIAGWAATTLVDALLGSVASIDYGVQLVIGLVVGAPFVYTTAGSCSARCV